MPALSKLFWTALLLLGLMSTALPQNIFNAQGKPLKKQAQSKREPKVVLDTLRMSSGFGVLRLNKSFKKGKHSVVASSTNDMKVQVTQILTDTSLAVNSYAVKKFRDSVMIKSSQAADSSLIEIRIDIR